MAELGGGAELREKDDQELFYDPEVAIDFMGWHLRNKINEVKHHVDKSGGAFPEHYKDIENDMKFLYMSYNNGAWGYLVLRRYLDNQTEENRNALTWFQKRDYKNKKGGSMGLEGAVRAGVGDKAAQVVKAFESFTS